MKKLLRTGPGIILLLLFITNFLNGGIQNPKAYFFNLLLSFPGIVIGLSFHEFAHAYVSNKLGDPTPKIQGRVTLNPMAHFDPFGFACLLFCGFGWGIPVEIDNRYYKHPRRDEILVSVAGVFMNLIVAIVFSFASKILIATGDYQMVLGNGWKGILFQIFLYTIMINLTLLVFNLIPIPPLDGFGILTELFNLREKKWYKSVYQNGFLILMIFLLLGIIDAILFPAVNTLYNFMLYHIIL